MADQETIYSPAGDAVTVSRLNALDLIRTSGYSWKPSPKVAEEIVEEAVAETIADEPEIAEEVPEEDEAELEQVDAHSADLDEVAAALAGTDAASYLNSFSTEALKTMAEERYGVKLRANVSKEKAVEQLLALEADRIAKESEPQD